MSDRASAVANLRRWRHEPIAFVEEVFGATPDAWQREVLAVLPTAPRIALKACKGPGKTCMLAWIIWWFLTCHPHAKILATSITGDNLSDNLWAELALWQKKSPLLVAIFTWSGSRIEAKESPETWFASARSFPRQADKSQQANTLAGLHGDYTLVVVDEVGDVPSGVVAAAEGSLSTGKVNKIVIVGNPTRQEGPLWDATTRDRARWYVKEITGDPDDPSRAPRISVKWAREQIEAWGRDNPWVMVNVFGKFPPTQSDKLLGPEECQAAAIRDLPDAAWMHEPKIMALDVARFGDDRSVICKRQGRACFAMKTYRNLDLMTLAGNAGMVAKKWRPDAIFVDEGGMGGGVIDRMRQLGFTVTGVNFGGRPTDVRFADKRSEMWWRMAEWVRGSGGETGGAFADDPELISELTAPSFSFNAASKLKLESKDELKKRGLVSPDKADALAMTFAEPVFVDVPDHLIGRFSNRKVQTEYDPYGAES